MDWRLPLWLRWQRIHLQCWRPGFDPWVGKIPWRREQLPAPVLLPQEFHGQRSLVVYSPCGSQRAGYNLVTNTHTGHMGLTFSQEPVNNGGLQFPFEVKLYYVSLH